MNICTCAVIILRFSFFRLFSFGFAALIFHATCIETGFSHHQQKYITTKHEIKESPALQKQDVIPEIHTAAPVIPVRSPAVCRDFRQL